MKHYNSQLHLDYFQYSHIQTSCRWTYDDSDANNDNGNSNETTYL